MLYKTANQINFTKENISDIRSTNAERVAVIFVMNNDN